MRVTNFIIITSITSIFIIGCSSSKDTTKISGENNNEVALINETEETKEGEKINTGIVSKGEKEDPREKLLADAIANYPDSLIAMLKKTPCYGRCPVFSFKIYSSGFVDYYGKANTEMEGLYSGKLTDENVAIVLKKIEKINFFELNNIYDTNVTDFPSVNVYANKDGKKKQIIDRQGGPKDLKELEALLDEMIKTVKWKKS